MLAEYLSNTPWRRGGKNPHILDLVLWWRWKDYWYRGHIGHGWHSDVEWTNQHHSLSVKCGELLIEASSFLVGYVVYQHPVWQSYFSLPARRIFVLSYAFRQPVFTVLLLLPFFYFILEFHIFLGLRIYLHPIDKNSWDLYFFFFGV